jgi:hypothetical protein
MVSIKLAGDEKAHLASSGDQDTHLVSSTSTRAQRRSKDKN